MKLKYVKTTEIIAKNGLESDERDLPPLTRHTVALEMRKHTTAHLCALICKRLQTHFARVHVSLSIVE